MQVLLLYAVIIHILFYQDSPMPMLVALDGRLSKQGKEERNEHERRECNGIAFSVSICHCSC